MIKKENIENKFLNESTIKATLENGLEVYISKKESYQKKIGMFGTKYGSIDNDFINNITNERQTVPDGIAHFLEHKLFEQEGENALDLFSKEGISANAYTSFDHTVYYFETSKKFEVGLEMLIKLVLTPYFTEENVEKEQGIISQEIAMYDDDPGFNVYFNALRLMYKDHPIKIDIAGSKESISKITKDVLYDCYNTFYNFKNMFIVIIGDVDIDRTLDAIEKNISMHVKNYISKEVKKFRTNEISEINDKILEKDMGLYMPQIVIGYKSTTVEKEELIKREIVTEIISEMFFSRSSEFFETLYNKGLINNELSLSYEGTDNFSHFLISGQTKNIEELTKNVFEFVEKIKQEDIDENIFQTTLKRKIGESIIDTENLNTSYRRIINAIISNSNIYSDIEILKQIKKEDIKEVLNLLEENKSVISIVK